MIDHGRNVGHSSPTLESLECRQLLASFYTGPSALRPVQSSGGSFLIQVIGPGVMKVNPAGRSGIDLSAFGTTNATTISITQMRPRWHFPSQLLVLNSVRITSGQLGGLDASPAELNGPMTKINNPLDTLELGRDRAQRPDQRQRQRGHMSVAAIDLGPSGNVVISGAINTNDLMTSMTVGSFNIDGGQFLIGQDSMAPISVTGSMTISHNGLFSDGPRSRRIAHCQRKSRARYRRSAFRRP